MTIRGKLAALMLMGLALYLVLDLLVQRRVILDSLLDLERREYENDLRSCVQTVRREAYHLDLFALDWSAWDDTYEFVQDGNADYAESNLTQATFEDARLNVIYLVARDGTVRFGSRYFNRADGVFEDFPDLPEANWPSDHPLLRHAPPYARASGIWLTSRGAMLTAAHPIVPTANPEGAEPAGTLVMMRLIGPRMMQEMVQQAPVPFELHTRGDVPPEEAGMFAATAGGRVAEGPGTTPDELHVYAALDDLAGRQTMLLHARIPREILHRGQLAMNLDSMAAAAAALFVGIAMLWMAHRAVSKPLAHLAGHVGEIVRTGELRPLEVRPARDEIGQLGAAFNAMIGRLRRDEAQRREAEAALARSRHMASIGEMSASIAHDIRNPLAGVRAAAQLLRGRAGGPPEDAGLLDAMVEHIDRVEKTIKHMLDFARAWRPERQSIDLRLLLSDVQGQARLQPECRHCSVEIDADGPCVGWVDPAMMRQVVWNLILNACQAMPEGGTVRVALYRAEGASILEVWDQGPGIAPEARDRLFEPFFTTRVHGTGLGLAICRRILEAHEATIAVASVPGQGTVARIRLAAEDPACPEFSSSTTKT